MKKYLKKGDIVVEHTVKGRHIGQTDDYERELKGFPSDAVLSHDVRKVERDEDGRLFVNLPD
jgi:hypothetical protein